MRYPMNQEDLTTHTGKRGPGVENAPYWLVPKEECDSCTPDLAESKEEADYIRAMQNDNGDCVACYKCCPCAFCDSKRSYHHLFVCPTCGCRVWLTSCAPFQCICVKDCNCTTCCDWDPDAEAPLYEAMEALGWQK